MSKWNRENLAHADVKQHEYDEVDNVNSPAHYGSGKIECIEYIEDFLTREEYVGYLRGNIAKYLHRWRYKNGLEDLKKAGLDRVNISLDTMYPDKFKAITGGGDIDSVWQSIKKAEKTGLTPVKINVVPIRGVNDDEILSFASLTFDNDYHIRFIEFMPATCNGIWKKDKCVSSAEAMEKISTLGRLEPLKFKGRGPSRNYRIKGAVGVIGFISPLSDHFCGECSRLRLTADGEIRPCLFSNIKIDIKTPMRNGASDEEIDDLFCKAVKVKPQRHLLNEDITSANHLKAMFKIGG